MMASEVPMQSCMRSSSGTSSTRNTSYSTGTITAPPPMPNRPANTPTTTPATTIQSASSASSPIGYPSSILSPEGSRREKSGRDVREIDPRVQHLRKRICHDAGAGPWLDRLGRQMAAEGARAGHRAEQAEDVSRDSAEPHAVGEFPLDVRYERERRLLRRGERRRLTEQQRIDRQQPPGFLISGAAHHDAVDMFKLLLRLCDHRDTAIDNDFEIGV